MKKLLLTSLMLLMVISPALFPGPAEGKGHSVEGSWDLNFEGMWIVSDYQEGGNITRRYDGFNVEVVKQGNIYLVDGPDWFFAETQFQMNGNRLEGTNIPGMERLKKNWPTVAESVLGSAYGKIVFKGTLTMLKDGRIAGEHNNWQINVYHNSGIFQSVKSYPHYFQFILTKLKPSV